MASISNSMASNPVSSGSENGDLRNGNGTIDEKKRKRMISNRESARRSRMKKQKQLDDLNNEASRLQDENKKLLESIQAKEDERIAVEAANGVLRAQTTELTDRLRFLESMIRVDEDVSGFGFEFDEIADCVINPWRNSNPNQSIAAASADMFYR